MKVITIAQPYAELIRRGLKRVENRTWPTSYRGPLAIHAGKSRDWFEVDELCEHGYRYGIAPAHCVFGAVIAVATLSACVSFDHVEALKAADPLAWMKKHEHTEGPWCWVLDDVKPLPAPVPCKGQLALWNWTPPEGLKL